MLELSTRGGNVSMQLEVSLPGKLKALEPTTNPIGGIFQLIQDTQHRTGHSVSSSQELSFRQRFSKDPYRYRKVPLSKFWVCYESKKARCGGDPAGKAYMNVDSK